MKRGYWGIGIYHGKNTDNIGTLWRSAHNFGASFIFVIGRRYHRQASDTTKAERHVPLYEYETFEEFKNNLPKGCQIVLIEQCEGASDLRQANHPVTAAYVLGAEDSGIPESIRKGYQKIYIDTPMCLNVAVAGSIVMYDRHAKE